MPLIKVKTYNNQIEAFAAKGYLENGGISKVLMQADISNYAGRVDGIPTGSVPQIILVPEEEAEKAKELLKELE